MTVPAIEVGRLVKRFGAFVAVEDLSFAVEPGEVLASWAATARASRPPSA